MIEKIKGLIENTQGIVELAWVQYKPQIEGIVSALKERKNAPERDIERLLDGISISVLMSVFGQNSTRFVCFRKRSIRSSLNHIKAMWWTCGTKSLRNK